MILQKRQIVTCLLGLVVGLLFAACAPQIPRQGAPVGRDVLYRDTFDPIQAGPWLTEGDSQAYTSLADGRLIIDVAAANLIQFVTLRDPLFDDFILEVDVRQLDGTPDSSHGILFRMQGTEAFYRFAITGTGFFIVERRDADGSWYRLMRDWAESPAINQGLNVTNQMRVEAVGSRLLVYVNGQLLQELVDTQYSRGAIALEAGTFGPGTARVAFDNLVVRQP
jgi:hypothetical protein